jgi:hypothetical protein
VGCSALILTRTQNTHLPRSAYFGQDLIKQLGKYTGVSLDVLRKVVQIVQQQRGVADRGSRAAVQALIQVMEDRGCGPEMIVDAKQMLAASRAAASPPAAAPAPAAPAVA